jgi:hypothetical protein
MKCYEAYGRLQAIRDVIESKLQNPKAKWSKGQKEKWESLRGRGMPENGDILYGSITETPADRETIVGLQDKLLHMLVVLQSADARPTEPALSAVTRLEQAERDLLKRWEAMK